MNKIEMAHDYAKELLGGGKNLTPDNADLYIEFIPKFCFGLAEAMLAENEKRKDKSLPEVLQDEFVIDWSLIDPEINYVAMDFDKKWHGYQNEPNLRLSENQWVLGDHDSDYVHLLLDGYQGDWKDSLRKRPE